MVGQKPRVVEVSALLTEVCVRSGFPGSSVQVDVVQALAQAGHVKGRRIYDSIAGTLQTPWHMGRAGGRAGGWVRGFGWGLGSGML